MSITLDSSKKSAFETALTLDLYKSRKDAKSAFEHAFLGNLPKHKWSKLHNFNADVRLSNDPFPKHSRQRGNADITSLRWHIKNANSQPIWIAKNNNGSLILLDGAHRIAAANLRGDKRIKAYIVKTL